MIAQGEIISSEYWRPVRPTAVFKENGELTKWPSLRPFWNFPLMLFVVRQTV